MGNLILCMQDPPAGDHIPTGFRRTHYYRERQYHHRGWYTIPLDYKLTQVWRAGFRGESSLGRHMGLQEAHLMVGVGEADFRLHRLEGAYGTEILKSDNAWELVNWSTYAASGWKILKFVLLVPAIAGVRHDECFY